MKIASFVAATFLLIVSRSFAQGNWPYHAGAADDCNCRCFRIGIEGGTSILSTWNQQEANPALPASPLWAIEERNANTFGTLASYAGLDLDLRISDAWRLHVRGGYAYDRITAKEKDANVDVADSTGATVEGVVHQSGIHGGAGYVETSLTAEWSPQPGTRVLGADLSFFVGAALRSRVSDLTWQWNEDVTKPGRSTFLASVSGTRTQVFTLANAARLRAGVQAGAALRWNLGGGVSLPVQIFYAHYLPRVADDEDVTDPSIALTSNPPGAATAHLSERDLQSWLNLRIGLALEL